MKSWYRREFWLAKSPSAEWIDMCLARVVFKLVSRLSGKQIQLPEFGDSEVKRCVVVMENKIREKRPDLVNFDNNCCLDDQKSPQEGIKLKESDRYVWGLSEFVDLIVL